MAQVRRGGGIVFVSLCQPRRRRKEVQESTISCDLGIVFESLCRPRRRENEGQDSTVSCHLVIVLSKALST